MEEGSEAAATAAPVSIDVLPQELLCLVLAQLDPHSLQQAGQVCQRWRHIANDDWSWRMAFIGTFGAVPYEPLSTELLPDPLLGCNSGWKQEFIGRLSVCRQWQQTNKHHRISTNTRIGTVDRIVVSRRRGWGLAVSRVNGAAAKFIPHTGKILLREQSTSDIIFAISRQQPLPPELQQNMMLLDRNQGGAPRASTVSARVDRICWGFDVGLSTITHLTRNGTLRTRVHAGRIQSGAVLDIAGPMDALIQQDITWDTSNAEDVVASSSVDGTVLVWCAETGQICRRLVGSPSAPLVRVTWANKSQYVVAASSAGVLFIWDLTSPRQLESAEIAFKKDHAEQVQSLFSHATWLTPRASEMHFYTNDSVVLPTHVLQMPGIAPRANCRVVQLTGDPLGSSFIVATSLGGVHRINAEGGQVSVSFSTTIHTDRLATAVTAVEWRVVSKEPFSSLPSNLQKDTKSRSIVPTVRVLLVGDASGSIWLFDGDASSFCSNDVTARHMVNWPHLHRCAISAFAINAGILVSAGRDGRVQVIDPLSTDPLIAIRCNSGGRRPAQRDQRLQQRRQRQDNREEAGDNQQQPLQQVPRRLDPALFSVHRSVVNEMTRLDAYLNQMLVLRTSVQWDQQVEGRLADALDEPGAVAGNDEIPGFYERLQQPQASLAHGFPALVNQIVAGYGWIVVANGISLQMCFISDAARQQLDGQHHLLRGSGRHRSHPAKSSGSNTPGSARLENTQLEITEGLEAARLEADRQRKHREEIREHREYVDQEFVSPMSELGLNADEQLEYALWLSSQQEQKAPEDEREVSEDSNAIVDRVGELSLSDMTEDEQLEYAMFLSRTSNS